MLSYNGEVYAGFEAFTNIDRPLSWTEDTDNFLKKVVERVNDPSAGAPPADDLISLHYAVYSALFAMGDLTGSKIWLYQKMRSTVVHFFTQISLDTKVSDLQFIENWLRVWFRYDKLCKALAVVFAYLDRFPENLGYTFPTIREEMYMQFKWRAFDPVQKKLRDGYYCLLINDSPESNQVLCALAALEEKAVGSAFVRECTQVAQHGILRQHLNKLLVILPDEICKEITDFAITGPDEVSFKPGSCVQVAGFKRTVESETEKAIKLKCRTGYIAKQSPRLTLISKR